MPDETEIQRLLRLKRYEKPPEDYFENFLREFHERQRAEILKRSLWRIAMDRLEVLFSDFGVGRPAYAMASVAVLVSAGFAVNEILETPESSVPRVAEVSVQPTIPRQTDSLNLDGRISSPQEMARLPVSQTGARFVGNHPRYILDARPVSYEPPSSY